MHQPRSRVAVLACAVVMTLATTAAQAKHKHIPLPRERPKEAPAQIVDVPPRPVMRTSAGAPDEVSARRRHHARRYHHHVHRHYGRRRNVAAMAMPARHQHIPDTRPRAWCGWWMRQQEGVRDRRFNLAREWANYGRPAGGPQIGAIVVWRHHVGRITGYDGRNWIVTSGNDGGAVRTRPRSVAGAVFRMPG